MPADLLIRNGRVFRGFGPGATPPHGSAEGPPPAGAPTAVAVERGRITYVGDGAGPTPTARGTAKIGFLDVVSLTRSLDGDAYTRSQRTAARGRFLAFFAGRAARGVLGRRGQSHHGHPARPPWTADEAAADPSLQGRTES